MNFSNLLNSLLTETVRKEGNRYYIYSHRTGKKIGKGDGYGSRGAAVKSMMMIASHGGFAKNPNKSSVIKKYEQRH